MTDTGPQQPEAKPAPKARRRGCLTAFLMLLVFGFGLICGGGATLGLVLRRVRDEVRHPEKRVDRASRWLTRGLDLSADQAQRVRAILAEQQAEFARVRRAAAPEVARRLLKTDEEVREVLTPAQRERWRGVVDELRARWVPPDILQHMRAPAAP